MANANLFQQYLQAPKSVVDYQNEYAKADNLKNQNALQSLTLQQAANVQGQRNSLRDLVQSGQIDLNDQAGLQKAVAIAPDVAPALAKTIQDQKTSAAKAGLDTAQAKSAIASAGKLDQETLSTKRQQHFSDLATVNTPEDALAWGTDGVRLGIISPEKFPAAVQALQQAAQTPQGFAQWKQQAMANSMTAAEQLKQQTAAPMEVRLGNVVKMIDMNPHSATFGKEVAAAQPIGVSPDTVANNQTSRANNSATIAAENARGAASLAEQRTHNRATEANGGGAGVKLTEDQGKATGWLVQAENAFGNMQSAMTADPSSAKPGFNDALGAVPGLGGLANSMRGAERQKFMQGASSLSEALLRAATGAGVNKDEAQQKIQELTPVFGEDSSTTDQKMAAIPLYIESLKVRAGPGAPKANQVLSAKGANPSVGGVPSDIAAILAKHGGR